MSYTTAAQSWHDFFLISGAAAATLVGLLFVGLSLHLRAVLDRPEVRGLARATLANFGLVLFVALFTVIPQDAQSAGLEMIITGAVSLIVISPSLVASARGSRHTIRTSLLILRFGVSVAGYCGTIAAGLLLNANSFMPAFGTLVSVSMALIVISLRNTWDLLVSVGEATLPN